jgi:hypothetical protein
MIIRASLAALLPSIVYLESSYAAFLQRVQPSTASAAGKEFPRAEQALLFTVSSTPIQEFGGFVLREKRTSGALARLCYFMNVAWLHVSD